MKNIFLEKSFTKCGGETRLRTFFKILKLSISLDQQSEDSYSLFSFFVQVEDYQNILKLCPKPLTFTWYKAFWKTKANLEQVSLPHFLHDFWNKIFTLYWQTKFHCLTAFICTGIRQYVSCNCLRSSLRRHKLGHSTLVLLSSGFLHN